MVHRDNTAIFVVGILGIYIKTAALHLFFLLFTQKIALETNREKLRL